MSIPVRVTQRSPRILRSGATTKHAEAWAAVSLDGLWTFEREDSPETPWIVRFLPCPGWYGLFSSLPKAREGAPAQLAFEFVLGFIHAHGLERPSRPIKVYVA